MDKVLLITHSHLLYTIEHVIVQSSLDYAIYVCINSSNSHII